MKWDAIRHIIETEWPKLKKGHGMHVRTSVDSYTILKGKDTAMLDPKIGLLIVERPTGTNFVDVDKIVDIALTTRGKS